jgi:hypothetical protein
MPGGPEFGKELFSRADPLPCGGDGERAIIRGKRRSRRCDCR